MKNIFPLKQVLNEFKSFEQILKLQHVITAGGSHKNGLISVIKHYFSTLKLGLFSFPKTLIIINILVLTGLYPIFSQAQNLPNVRLPSPQTQELNKYINFPVNYSTGIPEISIPLYVIKTKGVEIPITLNYHASGIKEGQDDGNVGVGWSLSCDYRVSRTIYGQPDSENIGMVNPNYYQNITNQYSDLELDKRLTRFVYHPTPNIFMPPKNSEPLLDGEYDQFNYSTPSLGGSFIISDRFNKTVTEFNPTNTKFNYLEGTASNNLADGIIGFSIKDVDQNVYSFGEQIDKIGSKVLETNNDLLDKRNVTAWALTDIDTKYGEKIKFSYENRVTIGKYKKQLTLDLLEAVNLTDINWEYNVNEESVSSNYSVFALASITTPNELIEFVEQSGNVSSNKKIQQINIYDQSTNSLVKRIDLFYRTLNVSLTNYVFLDSVKVYGKDLVNYQRYSFNYYDSDDYAPGYLTSNYLVPDQWGFNKVESNPYKLLHNEFGSDHALPSGSPKGNYRSGIGDILSNRFLGYFTNRTVNPNPELFSLKSINYPTGGKTTYDYEPNQLNQTQQWGGIRIKSIKHYDGKLNQFGQDILQLRRDYIYDNCNPIYPFNYNDFRKEYVSVNADFYSVLKPRRVVTYSSNALGDLPNSAISYYTQVTENLYSELGPNNGKVVYKFKPVYQNSTNAYPVSYIDPFIDGMGAYQSGPKHVSSYNFWQKPQILEKAYYSVTNSLLKKEVYSYTDINHSFFTGVKVRPFARSSNPFNEYDPGYFFSSYYNHGFYTLESGNSLITEKEDITYNGSLPITTLTSYAYNNLNQVVIESTTNSKNQYIEKYTNYPADNPYNYLSNRMLQANDVNKVLEEYVQVDGTTVSAINNEYNELPGDIFVLNKVKELNTINQSFEDKILFHKYDNQGNILSFSKPNGVAMNYLWSYKKQFPIAEIKGSTYLALENILGSTTIEQFGSLINPTKSEIDAFLAPIRSAINSGTLPNAQMTTYTYQPLVGMTSMTDAAGRTSYYEYDSFQRLQYVKNQDGNIIKAYCYNYAGQVTNCLTAVAPPAPITIYARVVLSNHNYYNNFQSFEEFSYHHDANAEIRLYSDAACTIPYVTTSSLSVTVETYYDYSSTYYGGGNSSYSTIYTIPSGSSSVSLDPNPNPNPNPIPISYTYYLYDPYYGYTYDSTTYQYYTIADGTNNYISTATLE